MASRASLYARHISGLLWALVVSLLLGRIAGEEDPQLSPHVDMSDASISVLEEFAAGDEKKVAATGTADRGEIWIAHLGVFLDHKSGRGPESVSLHGISTNEGDDVLESDLPLLEQSGQMELKGKETNKFGEVNNSRSDEAEDQIGDMHNIEHGQMVERKRDGNGVESSERRKPQLMFRLGSFSFHRHILEKAEENGSDTLVNESPKEVKNKVVKPDLKPAADKKDDGTVIEKPKAGEVSSPSDVPKWKFTENNSGDVDEDMVKNLEHQTSKEKQNDTSHVKTTEDVTPKVKPDEASPAKISEDKTSKGKPSENDTINKHLGDGGPNELPKQQTDCNNIHSCGDVKKMVACLRTSGEGTHELSLLVQNKGDNTLNVKVTVPDFLSANPSAPVVVEKGKSITVQIVVVDPKAAKHADRPKLNITTGDYDCSIELPTQYPGNLPQRRFFQGFSYPYMTKPVAIVYMLFFVLVGTAIGVWLCCRCSKKRWRGDGIKYRELEIGDLHHERVNKSEDEALDGWNEVWDDGWKDTEAARLTSRPISNLSSNGLASRRSNKGWETGWDD